uniref:Uncharacterized protein n=1 Tax=Lotharella vacuolata TaxID=74820 RepID=A0A0H5BK11_9EUKA|nr:hypothetical protein [Lotharella vacuolata]
MNYNQIIKKKFHLQQIQLFYIHNKYFKKYSNFFFLKNQRLFINNNSYIYIFDLKKGSLKNFYFVNFSKINNKTLHSDKLNIRLFFPLKNSFNIFNKKSIYNFSWNIIGTQSSFKNTHEKKFQIFLKSNLNFYNLIYEVYYTINFDSKFNNALELTLRRKIQNLNIKFFIINKRIKKYFIEIINIKFKSLISMNFTLENHYNSFITKKIFGLQGLKYFEKNELKINTTKFLTLNSLNLKNLDFFVESIFMNVTREKLFLIINPKIIYKIENRRGFLDFLIQHSGQLVSISSGSLVKNICLKQNEAFIGETTISGIFNKF